MKMSEPMGDKGKAATPASIDELLAHAAWLRALALRLARDPATADDAVQETWIAAMRRAPEPRESERPWLARVLRNALRMRARADGRRAARERVASLASDDEVPTPEAMLARAETQRLLAALVLRLDEPYRSTVLLHYCEGVSLADIARTQGIAASTARWRLKTALDQLRAWLDAEGGGRETWAVALLAVPEGALMAQKTKLLVPIVVALLLLGAGGLWWWTAGGSGGGESIAGEPVRGATGAGRALRATPGGDQTEIPAWLAQPGVAARSIAGRVVFKGSPVPGATVELINLATRSELIPRPSQVTGAGGAFDFGPRPAMTWWVRANAPGKTGATVEIDLRDPSARPGELVLELGDCESALFGTVSDSSGGPIAGARLARRESGAAGGATETDADGAYELCVQSSWPRWMSVEIAAAGYGAIVFSGRVGGRMRFDFALVPEAVVTGRVVRDDTGEPVAGAHVFVRPGPWGIESSAWRGTFADRDGRFRIDGVAPGRRVVSAQAEGLIDALGETSVIVDAGQTAGPVELRLAAASRLRGVVVEAGEPVAGAEVSAVSASGQRSPRAVSQADGSFVLDGAPRGPVRFVAPPYDVVAPRSFTVDRAEHAGLVIEVEGLGAVAGRVVHDRRPVAGARIDLAGPNARQLGLVTTGADGRFEIRGLEPGPWLMFASSQRHGAFGRVDGKLQIRRGETEQVEIDLAYGASVSGVVVDQDGDPVAGVTVQLTHTGADDQGTAITAADGSFRAAMMMGGGTYKAAVLPGAGATAPLEPAAGAFPPIVLDGPTSEVSGVILAVKRERLAIAGRVVDTSGAPVPDARLAARAETAGAEPRFYRWLRDASTISDASGGFSIGALPAGRFALQAVSPSGTSAILRDVAAGRSGVVVTLPAPGSIAGELVGFTGAPRVFAVDASAPGGPPVHGDVSGDRFTLRDLSPGDYLVTATSGGEAATARASVAPGATAAVTLSSRGSGAIRGRVVEFRTGRPVEGARCQAAPRIGDHIGRAPDAVRTGADGGFVIDPAPAGEVAVLCAGLGWLYSNGLRAITVPAGGERRVDVPVVSRRNDGGAAPVADLGASLERFALVARLTEVRPGGPAARAGLAAGDRIVAVDGASVTELSPTGVLVLIANRRPGSVVEIEVDRAGARLTREVTLGEIE